MASRFILQRNKRNYENFYKRNKYNSNQRGFKMRSFKPLQYKKGFMTKKGRMLYGYLGMLFYTCGYINYHVRRILK